MILVLNPLGVEEKALSCLGSMSSIAMSNILGLFIAEVCREMLVLKRGIAKPEVLFGEDEPSKICVNSNYSRPKYFNSLLTSTQALYNSKHPH